jgi:hypothetical protein
MYTNVTTIPQGNGMVKVVGPCVGPKDHAYSVIVPVEQYNAYYKDFALAQVAFPDLPKEEREFLISGTLVASPLPCLEFPSSLVSHRTGGHRCRVLKCTSKLMRRPIQGQIRFEAEWVTEQHSDTEGEWNPDLDEYATSIHTTKAAAEQAAINGAKKSGIEWIMVAEQKYIGYQWVDLRRWTGDYDGLQEETSYDEGL